MKMIKFISLLLIAALIFAMTPLFSYTEAFDYTQMSSAGEWDLLKATNNVRISNGLLPLSIFPSLQNAADIRAAELATSCSHSRPNGQWWFTVLDELSIPYDSDTKETIAAGYTDINSVLSAWLKQDTESNPGSITNRDVILSPLYTHIGVGINSNLDNQYGTTWAMIFLTCKSISGIKVCTDNGVIPHLRTGVPAENQNLILEINCSHGKSYLPVTNSMISGYNPDYIGEQTITVNYGAYSTTLKIFNDFNDVYYPSWYYDFVMTAYNQKLFSGIGNNKFAPDSPMTRAMFVTVLGNLEGINTADYSTSNFTDVKSGSWYAPYVTWAAQCGLVSGTGNNKFSPDDPITREQICVILLRYTEIMDIKIPLVNEKNTFSDESNISQWAMNAVEFCQRAGIVAGMNQNKFNPKNYASRAEVATIFIRFAPLIGK